MKATEIKEDIIKMLEDIISRTDYINFHHPQKNLSLDIDLVKDDLRMLYRYFDLLKNMATHPEYMQTTGGKPDEQPDEQLDETSDEQTNEQLDVLVDDKADEQVVDQVEEQIEDEADEQLEDEADEQLVEKAAEQAVEEVEEQPESISDDSKSEASTASDADQLEEMPVETTTGETDTGEAQTADEELIEKNKPEESAVETGVKAHVIKPADLMQDFEDRPKEKSKPEDDTASVQKESATGKSKKSIIDLLGAYSQKTIGDQYAEADNSLNKRISGDMQDNSIGARMQLIPISNIKEVIGLNEKFLFINELFSGNIQEYHDAIAQLNGMENMQSAFDYLNELSNKYSWDTDRSTETIRKLATYVQRRYLKTPGQ